MLVVYVMNIMLFSAHECFRCLDMHMLQDLLKKIQLFQQDVRREVGAELMDLSQLEMLLEDFIAPPDIDIPELTQLKKVTTTG